MDALNVNSRFSTLPEVDIQRSKVKRPSQLKTTFNTGELIPIFLDQDVLPGSTYTLDMSSLVRMTTPIFPVMDNAFLDVYFFFIPNRLVWNHWREFMGESPTAPWINPVEYSVPQLQVSTAFQKGSLGDYFGLPTYQTGYTVSALPFRAYALVWNEFFRDQNTMYSAYCSTGDANSSVVASVPNPDFSTRIQNAVYGANPLLVSKYHDYFTSCLPQPQKGPSVDLPLYNDLIPVVTSSEPHNQSHHIMTYDIINGGAWSPNYTQSYPLYASKFSAGNTDLEATLYRADTEIMDNSEYVVPNNLYANVSNVAVATISQLRQAFQIQKLYERDARGGTRYRELLKSHFGVDNSDGRMQVPEYLGGKRIPINVDQVLQTSSTNDVSPQGNTSAYSLTTDVSSLFTKSFTEHGILLGLACVRTEHTYQQGIERGWSRKNRFDYYWPTLAHLSEQAVLVKEIYCKGVPSDEDAFGYQEAWAEYRYKPSRVTGAFRSNYAQSLDAWHYADFYEGSNEDFVLSPEWLSETKVNVDRTLAVQSSVEDQFLADFYFDLECVLPMPLYSIPGLVDHY